MEEHPSTNGGMRCCKVHHSIKAARMLGTIDQTHPCVSFTSPNGLPLE
jgi:hypothetical protein